MMRYSAYLSRKMWWMVGVCGLLLLTSPAARAKTVVSWDDYRHPFQQPIHIFQYGEHRLESAEIHVTLPQEFVERDEPIALVIELQSRTLSKQTKAPNFDSFSPYLKINSKMYAIPIEPSQSSQIQVVKIKPKDIKAGENTFTATFRWHDQSASCSGQGCGYEILALYFKGYGEGTSSERQYIGLDDLFVVFEESFDSNVNSWNELEQPEAVARIRDGKLVIAHKRDSDSWLLWNEIPLDQTRDFAISATIRKVSGVNDHGYGLIWGLQDAGNLYQFLVAGDGFYKYEKLVKNEWQELIPWTPSAYINTRDAANTLAVRKAGDRLLFFINEQWIDEALFEPFFGNNIGFALNLNMTVECDDLILRQ